MFTIGMTREQGKSAENTFRLMHSAAYGFAGEFDVWKLKRDWLISSVKRNPDQQAGVFWVFNDC